MGRNPPLPPGPPPTHGVAGGVGALCLADLQRQGGVLQADAFHAALSHGQTQDGRHETQVSADTVFTGRS